jgi:hypothetical protein
MYCLLGQSAIELELRIFLHRDRGMKDILSQRIFDITLTVDCCPTLVWLVGSLMQRNTLFPTTASSLFYWRCLFAVSVESVATFKTRTRQDLQWRHFVEEEPSPSCTVPWL